MPRHEELTDRELLLLTILTLERLETKMTQTQEALATLNASVATLSTKVDAYVADNAGQATADADTATAILSANDAVNAVAAKVPAVTTAQAPEGEG